MLSYSPRVPWLRSAPTLPSSLKNQVYSIPRPPAEMPLVDQSYFHTGCELAQKAHIQHITPLPPQPMSETERT